MGKYTIKQAIVKTYKSHKFGNRFDYKNRDSVRIIRVQKIHTMNWHGKTRQLSYYYEVVSQSFPKYYTKEMRRKVSFFRKIKHQYEIFLRCEKLSFNDSNWQVYLGSARRWNPKPPQSQIATIYRENLKKWKPEEIKKHRKRKHPYIDVGDYNSQVNGINGDFRFRCCYVYEKYGHLFHKRGIRLSAIEITKAPKITNSRQEFFLPKHIISLFETLINKGILKEA
ncbi:MAG TPA: hypothetical protein P5023_06180 [Bacteroidales bacterium]|nr:hypothetical protein [Bacteroidales bacterium]